MNDQDEPSLENTSQIAENAPQQATEHSGGVSAPESKVLVKAPDLYEQMAKTWALEPDDLMLLVNTPPKGTLTLGMAMRVRAASMQYGIPIPGFNLIPDDRGGYTLYVNSGGVQFKFATDPRGVKSIRVEAEHMPDLSKEQQDYIDIKATVTMKDEAVAEDWGTSEWPPTGKDRNMRFGDLKMKLTTKAIRRAEARLVGLTLPIFDEDYYSFISGPGKEVMDAEYTIIKPKPKPKKPTVLNELLVMALGVNEELNATKLMEMMSVNAITELDIEKTWEKIKNEYGNSAETT